MQKWAFLIVDMKKSDYHNGNKKIKERAKMTFWSLRRGNEKIRYKKSTIENMVIYYHKVHFIRVF